MIILKYEKIYALIFGLVLCLPVLNHAMETHFLSSDLSKSVFDGDIENARKILNNGYDLNKESSKSLIQALFMEAITSARRSLSKNNADVESRFQILELILQSGANVNLPDWSERHPLLNVVWKNEPTLPIIDLLLKYGADIGEDIKQKAREKLNSEKIFELFSYHENLREQAANNPTDNLLTWAIGYNYPHIVKLIVNSRPELVNNLDLHITYVTSPGSVKILKKVLLMKKLNIFKQYAEERNMPSELIAYTEKIVKYNKQ